MKCSHPVELAKIIAGGAREAPLAGSHWDGCSPGWEEGYHSIILQFRTSTELKSPGLGAQVLGYTDTWVLESNSPLLGTPPEAYQVAPVYVIFKVR